MCPARGTSKSFLGPWYRLKKSARGIRRNNGVFLSYDHRERGVEVLQSAGGLIAIFEKDAGRDERVVRASYRDERIVRRDQDQTRYELGPSPGGLAGDAAAQRFAKKNYLSPQQIDGSGCRSDQILFGGRPCTGSVAGVLEDMNGRSDARVTQARHHLAAMKSMSRIAMEHKHRNTLARPGAPTDETLLRIAPSEKIFPFSQGHQRLKTGVRRIINERPLERIPQKGRCCQDYHQSQCDPGRRFHGGA